MDNLVLLPLQSAEASEGVSEVEIQSAPGTTTKRVLRLDADETLSVVPLEDMSRVNGATNQPHRQVALLCGTKTTSDTAWFVMGCCGDLMVNGVSPLELMRVDRGALLSLGGHCWWAASIWRPQPAAAPAELAARPCPVCGGPLSLAPVVQCPCGRWTHLERPEQADSPDALNCYLAAAKCDCGRAASLEPQISPQPPGKLLAAASDLAED